MRHALLLLVGFLLCISVAIPEANAQVEVAADINPGPDSSVPNRLEVHLGYVFFWADDGVNGQELWSYDGARAQLIADLTPGAAGSPNGNSSYLSAPVFDGRVYVKPRVGGVQELWSTDGVNAERVTDLDPVVGASGVFQGRMFLGLADDAYGHELWVTDQDTVVLFADLYPGAASSSPWGLTVLGERLLFRATDEIYGRELRSYDGSEVRLVADITPGPASTDFSVQSVTFRGALYFTADDGVHGRELWKSDGLSATLVRDLNPGQEGGNPYLLMATEEWILFRGNSGTSGSYGLWVTDGDEFQFVTDVPGYNYTYYQGTLYFFYDDMEQQRVELWAWDGESTEPVFTLCTDCLDPNPGGLTPFEGALYFVADDGVHGRELWRTDGQSAELVADIAPGSASSNPSWLTVLGDQLVFSASSPEVGWELMRYTPEALAVEGGVQAPSSILLENLYPNPARRTVTASYVLDRPQEVALEVLDVLGRAVHLEHLGRQRAGSHETKIAIGGVAPGLYLLRLLGEEAEATQRFVVVR